MNIFRTAATRCVRGSRPAPSYKWDRWNVYANYTYVDATFLQRVDLVVAVQSLCRRQRQYLCRSRRSPDRRFRTFASSSAPSIRSPIHGSSAPTSTSIGSQYLVGDESNQNPKIPAYWVVNLHSSYQISKNVELFGLVQEPVQPALLRVRHVLRHHLISLFEPDRPAHLRAGHAVRRLCRSAGDVLAHDPETACPRT